MKKILFSLLCSAAIAAATPVSVSFVDPGTSGITDASNNFVGPYTLKIGGNDVAAMCMDDFYETRGSWKANVTGVNATNFDNTYLGNTFTVDGVTAWSGLVYQAEAYIFSEIIRPGADRVDLQDAAWDIMDYVTGHPAHSTSAAVENILENVFDNDDSFDASAYEIVTQTDPGRHPEQEFIVATPEPASLGLLGGALLLLGIKRIKSKPRQTAEVSE